MFEDVTLENVEERSHDLPIQPTEAWHVLYKNFICYFQQLGRDLSVNDFVVSASFAYAWMPRILNLRAEISEEAVQILNRAKSEQVRITTDEMDTLKELVDNSIVGVSKLLHFVNPQKYTI